MTRHRYRTPLLLALAISVALGCGGGSTAPSPGVEEALQGVVDALVADDPTIHGAALAVDAPALGIEWEGASGFADPASGTVMTPAHAVRIASNTKTYVAAAILRLVEDRRLDLDAGVSGLLPSEIAALLRSDGYDLDAMTLRHLLTHTSGLFDHSETGAYTEAIMADPQHRWTPIEQVRLAVEIGDPHAPPGVVYTYCDTGYVLLGLVIEGATGRPLAEAVRELVDFESLGLRSTWWETLEPAPTGVVGRAHQFYGELDTYAFDPSCDLYGGGGIVATVGDLARLFGGIFRGRVYRDATTVETMLTTVDGVMARPDAGPRALPPGAYRMGVWVLETGQHTTYRHTGFWGTMAVYLPDLDLTLAATTNQNQSSTIDRIPAEVIALVGGG